MVIVEEDVDETVTVDDVDEEPSIDDTASKVVETTTPPSEPPRQPQTNANATNRAALMLNKCEDKKIYYGPPVCEAY